ncbi:isocitrate/isopropylmalate family dehydrogenase, partial [bacterium]|nr:isocitrate/isopropylmalate family dehydrogenase [bacterium]
MPSTRKVVVLPGDGIGPEIVDQALRVLDAVNDTHQLGLVRQTHLFGGAAYDETGKPLPEDTLAACRDADAILMGSIGGPQYDAAPRELRPERGLLGLRSELKLFANLRPAMLYPQLASASSL